ncbi:MAG: hypothetical protein QNJ51_20165 [Calothrix sp. MO_167.B12]|nr:hypothetical protein [Calothrix sp. MO_167.B12]
MNDLAPTGQLLLDRLDINPKEVKNIKPRWKRTNYRAVINWLTLYKPQHDASDLEKIHGLLEAFHHLCQTET